MAAQETGAMWRQPGTRQQSPGSSSENSTLVRFSRGSRGSPYLPGRRGGASNGGGGAPAAPAP